MRPVRPTAARALALIAAAAIVLAACSAPPAGEGDAVRGAGDEAILKFWGLYREATTLRMSGDFAAAADRYEAALSIDPRHEDCLYYLGQCRLELGRADDARRAFEALIQVNPASARGHLSLGSLHASASDDTPFDPEAARRYFSRAHEINGEETAPMVRLGEALIVLGRTEEALSWLRAALGTNPKSVEAAFLAGYLLWERGDAAGAADMYRRAVGASTADAPIKGVLNEGDRRATTPGRVAAPPLSAPMGQTLFGEFSAHLRREGGDRSRDALRLDAVYAPVRERAAALARRASARS